MKTIQTFKDNSCFNSSGCVELNVGQLYVTLKIYHLINIPGNNGLNQQKWF